ncbi:hypothetical protein DFH06DRAFT_624544 [Mycena polygramma]|nr:hypothetical protein DFH06DRAFT_624544 [Mycena polygramma]
MNSQPEDILREIFKQCLDTRYPHVQPFLPGEAPLLLCGVCVLWRAIALTTSELWAHLSVSIGHEGSDKPQPSPELIKTWIARSGCQPLTLTLKDWGLRPSGADTINDLLALFLPEIHRWRSITLALPNHAFPAALIGLERGASQLQIANLGFGVDPGLHAADTPQVAALSRLLTSSQVHTLYWHNAPSILQFLDIHWAHLTVIDLVPVWSPMSQILLMQKAPKLRSLSVFVSEGCDVAAPVVLSDLVILWIGAEVDVGPLFEQLIMPSLLNINVFGANLVPPVPQTEVLHCITRSGSTLDVAVFKSLHIFNSDLITFLRLTPSLRLFEISNNGEATITDNILRLLTAGNTPCLGPNLQIIRFLESSISSTDGLLADMVESRRTADRIAFPAVLLSRLVIHFSEADVQRHREDIRRLKTLAEAEDFQAWINEPETA